MVDVGLIVGLIVGLGVGIVGTDEVDEVRRLKWESRSWSN
jgi:hypothetical protein